MIPVITPIQLYQLPDDAGPVRSAILHAIDNATSSIRMLMYGFTDPEIADHLTAAAARGVDVALLLDHSQSCGPTECQLVSRMLSAGFPPSAITITTSPVARQLMHEKLLVADGTVMWGSLNFSPSGFEQVNTWCTTTNATLADAQREGISGRITWARQFEPLYQTVRRPAPHTPPPPPSIETPKSA